MANGGFAAIGVFRKHRSENAIKTKYPTMVRTAEQIAAEEEEKANVMAVDSASESEEEVQVATSKSKKQYTIDDIMTLDQSLKITKKKIKTNTATDKSAGAAAGTAAALQDKSKGIKKKKHCRKSQKIVKFWLLRSSN